MILLHLKAKEMRWGNGNNPKNYPWINELKDLITEEVVEITKPIPLKESMNLIDKARKIICIDSYLQHLAWYMGKQAIVLFGQSDPEIFGHKENINLLKDRKYLREKQYWMWEQTECNDEAFLQPEEIMKLL